MSAPKSFDHGLYAGGQPTPGDLARLAGDGVRTVINLRAPTEPTDFDEASESLRLGIRYVQSPLSGAEDLDRALVERFGCALDTARAEGGVLIHCASSNRVGAMVALDGMLNRGQPLGAALKRGRAAGLGSLEPAVVALARAESRV
jgi:uncharacterized protein (TIGR01244 family)